MTETFESWQERVEDILTERWDPHFDRPRVADLYAIYCQGIGPPVAVDRLFAKLQRSIDADVAERWNEVARRTIDNLTGYPDDGRSCRKVRELRLRIHANELLLAELAFRPGVWDPDRDGYGCTPASPRGKMEMDGGGQLTCSTS